MSNTTYYLAWLAAGLAIVAALSAAITRQVRWRALRRLKAEQLLEALAAYTSWVAAQRGAAYFEGDGRDGDSPVREVRRIQREWFPELSGETAELLDVHARLIDFLWTQQVLRLNDAEAWLDSDHDGRFDQLWRLHREAVRSAEDELELLAGGPEPSWEGEPAGARARPGLRGWLNALATPRLMKH